MPIILIYIISLSTHKQSSRRLVAEPSVDEILQYLKWLMQWYCREPSMLMATIIVSRLEGLRERQANGEITIREWSCSRLIRNWECLAARCRRK